MMSPINSYFSNFLAEGNILAHVNGRDSESVIRLLVQQLVRNNAGLAADDVFARVMEREEVMTTVIAPGLAVPHARLSSLDHMLVAMATSREGISWKGDNGVPVKVCVMVLTPEDDPGLHLQVLTALAKEFSDPEAIGKTASLSSASEVFRFFSGAEVELPPFLRAQDVMEHSFPTLKENDTLRTAINFFARSEYEEVPVVDDDGDMRGVISLSDILRFSLPEHILWMNDLRTVDRFQPFAETLSTADETKLADVLREEFIKVDLDMPAIQLAKLFILHNVRQLIVADEKGRPAGVVRLKDFCAKLFWE